MVVMIFIFCVTVSNQARRVCFVCNSSRCIETNRANAVVHLQNAIT